MPENFNVPTAEPASKQELKEFSGDLFVPKNNKEAIDYYQKKRTGIIYNPNLSNQEKKELLNYYDKKGVIRTIESNEEYKRYFNDNHNNLDRKFIEGALKALSKEIGKEHFNFRDNITFISDPKNPVYGLGFKAEIKDVESINKEETKILINFKLSELEDLDEKFSASLMLDKESGEARAVVARNGVDEQNPNLLVKDRASVSRKELEIILTVLNLAKPNTYDSRIFMGNRKPADSGEARFAPTKIKDNIESLLPYRRRTIDTSNITNIQQVANELISGWDNEDRKILEQQGNGSIILRLYEAFGNNGINYRFLGNANSTNLNQITTLARSANPGNNILITFEHAWRPPELDNSGPGSPHRPHTRRSRGNIVLAIGGTVSNDTRKEIINLWRDRKRGLPPEHQKKLKDFLDRYKLTSEVDVELEIVPGIHYKNGRFSPNGSNQLDHIYST